jgi:phosphoserine phosphatase RsbU/P
MAIDHGYLLVVDADPISREVLNRQLEQRGYTVALAGDGRQAIAMLEIQTYDLVLLALDLPEMDGTKVLQALKQHTTLQAVPVIMLAGETDIQRIEACLDLGSEDYISTPMNMVLAQKRIRSCLEYRRLHSQGEARYSTEAVLKMERDLAIGQQIQLGFLPKELLALPGWELAAYYNPAREVGGDVYDAFVITQSGLVALVIGDVCDKGVGAAIFMALFRSFIRAAAQQEYPLGWTAATELGADTQPTPPAWQSRFFSASTAALRSAFELTNRYVIHNHGETAYFITLFFGVLEPETGALRYINGGHLPVFIIGQDGIKARLSATSPAIGILPDAAFTINQAQLAPGDILFSYTDGITDARDPERRLFGAERLAALVEQPARSAQALVERVDTNVSAHIANAEQYDDITMLAVRREPVAAD